MLSAPWHTFSSTDVLHTLGSHPLNGLDDAAVEKSRKEHGHNVLPHRRAFRLEVIVFKQLMSPLALVLIAAGAATLFLHEWIDSVVISVALLINIALGIYQEGRASRVFDALAQAHTPEATVVRNGRHTDIPASALVVGDIVVLAAGKQVPADVRLIEAQNLSINESAFTGEWAAVRKQAEKDAHAEKPEHSKAMAWGGTLATEGSGKGVVVAVGKESAFGRLAQSVVAIDDEKTPLMRSIEHLARIITLIVLAIVLGILALGVWQGQALTDMFLIAVAVAVAAMPEGMPASITVVLSAAMQHLLGKKGLVKSLLAAETLGATTVILVDKTGTLTTGDMSIAKMVSLRGIRSNECKDDDAILTAALLASDGYIVSEEGAPVVRGRPVERAIVEAALRRGVTQEALFNRHNERLDFLAFSSHRRYAASLNSMPTGGARVYLSGAPETLLALASGCAVAGGVQTCTQEMRTEFVRAQEKESMQGRRLIGVAYMDTREKHMPESVLAGTPKNLVFMGYLVIEDTVRTDVHAEIARAHDAHVRVIMVTGDFPETARAIAQTVGIITAGDSVCAGSDIDALSDEDLRVLLRSTNVFARVLPEQKLRIAQLLRADGEVVAMTGDGVNDAPALRAADIGIAVGSGTDVAKAAADMVLLDNTFTTITAAIEEGRRAVANIQKVVLYLLSTSASEVLIIVGALFVGMPLPLLPTQLLWTNIIHEGLMSVPYAFEPASKGAMRRRPRGMREAILTRQLTTVLVMVSIAGGAMLFGFYLLLSHLGFPLADVRTATFAALSLSALAFSLSFKNVHQPLWRIGIFNNPALLLGIGGSLLILVVSLTFPPLMLLLSLTTMSLPVVGLLLGFAVVEICMVEGVKWLARQGGLRNTHPAVQ